MSAPMRLLDTGPMSARRNTAVTAALADRLLDEGVGTEAFDMLAMATVARGRVGRVAPIEVRLR